MLHALRISLLVLVAYGLFASNVNAEPSDDETASRVMKYQQRVDNLAKQLYRMQQENSPQVAVYEDAVGKMNSPAEKLCAKSTLVAASLHQLLANQVPEPVMDAPADRRPFYAVDAVDVTFPEFGLFSSYQQEIDPAPVQEVDPEPQDAPDEAPPTEAPEEAVEVTPPLPPAPRVQPTEQVREANVSLVSQLRGLVTRESEDEEMQLRAMPAESPEVADVRPSIQQAVDVREEPGRPATLQVDRLRPPVDDPLGQLVDLDFRNADLTHVVALLALKADINVIAGADLRGSVTANLRQVPLKLAMETALRMNDLGIIEEDGIYLIIPYAEAATVNRKSATVFLDKAKARDVVTVLQDQISGIHEEAIINITAHPANVLVISGPKIRVDELVDLASALDMEEPVIPLPTITKAISLNYAEPRDLMSLVGDMLTDRVGQVSGDDRSRHLVVTDLPVVVEQVTELVKQLDNPTKQVMIETMVVDAVLSDEADTGVQWLIDSVRRMSRRQAALGDDGRAVGNLQEFGFLTDLEALQNPGSLMNFSVLTDRIDWRGLIQLEVRNRNGRLVSNPILMTVENEAANISISQEIPYIELTQTAAGGQQTSTRFKEVGTILSVTPRVTHDNTIITTIEGKESTTSGTFQGIPIEDKREIQSTMRMGNGQTIFIGGLRKSDAVSSVRKVPVLGDLPVVNFMFRANQRTEQINELLVFLTCTVIESQYPELTPYQQDVLDEAPPLVPRVDAWETVMHDTVNPHATKNTQMKWRRGT